MSDDVLSDLVADFDRAHSKTGNVSVKVQKIDGRTRKCIVARPRPPGPGKPESDGQVIIEFKGVQLGNELVVDLGTPEEGERRAAVLEIYVNDGRRNEVPVPADAGWRRFAIKTEPLFGASIRLVARVGVDSTPRIMCFTLEARK